MRNDDEVWRLADAESPAFFDLSDSIWDRPELSYQEVAATADDIEPPLDVAVH